MKDLIIVGAGPAGITAAVYSARKKLDFSVLTRDIGGQAAWSGEVGNYTGYQFITGPDLAQKFADHLMSFDFELAEGVGVSRVEKIGSEFRVKTDNGKDYDCRSVIIASGKQPRPLGVPGEAEFRNRGVTYCATCDGPLFSGKDVAVIGGGNSALDAVLQLIRFAGKVYLINHQASLIGDPVLQEKVGASAKVEVLNRSQVDRIAGDKFVRSLTVKTNGIAREIAVQGVFVEIGSIPNSDLIDFVEKNRDREIIVDRAAQTSVPGIFAAGDVTDVMEKQIIIAAGEGAKAALSAFRYLSLR